MGARAHERSADGRGAHRRSRFRRATPRGAPRARVLAPQRRVGGRRRAQRGAARLHAAAAGRDPRRGALDARGVACRSARRRAASSRARHDPRGALAPARGRARRLERVARLARETAPAPANRVACAPARARAHAQAAEEADGSRRARARRQLRQRLRRLRERWPHVRHDRVRFASSAEAVVERDREPALRNARHREPARASPGPATASSTGSRRGATTR